MRYGRLIRTAAGLTAAAALTGCWTEGGRMMSVDSYAYVSTPWQPKTVSVVDTVSGETIWSVDVPVGQRLAMQFRKNKRPGHAPDPSRPDVLQWDLMPAEHVFGQLHNQIAVPASHSRRVEMKLRATPEAPGATLVRQPVSRMPYQSDREQPDVEQWRRSDKTPTPAAEPMPIAEPASPPPAEPEPPVDLPEGGPGR